ncbi:receptor-like protein kinase FERONIA [Rhodamnia argentea]|uniref:Receptor-like protein kinase FERONIA n=1 Tax=Rhodamnia argentea TaxID=178133 RepID=A0ABM3HTA7_9MYRT|nr:receptor-like protein kinase FERONIA [Rhodamnia argentea]XP_048139826.1 receptor-like protein kinase FERONIA [Rhodamnia argentea]XP_048139827.1 receptor-like protein kinase FERONIA [Rhodamnia argentea]
MGTSSDRFHCDMKNMKPPLLLFISISVSLAALAVSVTGDNVGAYRPTDDIAVDCGFSGDSTADDNRAWVGDADGSSKYSPIEKTRSSVNASANSPSPDVRSSVPYYTARLSRSEFAYTFHVTAGPKFVRLHFFPSDYLDFRRADSFFSVEAAGYTLLRNFRADLFADYTSSASFSKEFCLTVGDDQILNITFTPTPGDSDNYAFVNGIEVVSMPESLYYNTVIDLKDGIELAGQETPYTFGATDALEAVKRLNVGGQSHGPADDTGMYRTWDADDVYVTSSYIGVLPVNTTIQLSYSDQVPNYTAPDSVYMTARTMGMNRSINLRYNLTWSVEVDAKFYYLVRLHFCEFQIEVNKRLDRAFKIFINSQLVENHADVISWSGKGMPVYRDYAVYMDGGHKKTTNLSVALGALPVGDTVYSDAILNGLEIFKINNPGGNLAGLNPDLVPDNQPALPPASKASSSNHGKTAKIVIIAGVASGFAVLSLLAFFLYRRRNGAKDSASSDGTSWWGPVSYATTKSTKTQGSSLPSDLCRHFSLAEIKAATNDFDEVFIIGVGGFGNVYKGYVDGGATQVAIKRLNPRSQQGLHEFMTEIEMLSQLRHLHLVSLIGFCNDAGEMILVYDYMPRGTLRDHLYNTDNPPLPWKQRLEICTGAARGLHYLHTGAKHTIIHRDMKTTNILLDEKWVAKVSDFGLSKVGPTSVSKAHVSTVVKGTFGYMDPEYYRRQQLTDKSDVYSFGVVLFEVLCARPAVNRTAQKKQISLAAWAQSCCKSGAVDKMVDPHLKGAIAPECLNKFCEIAMSCLQDEGTKRPSMNDVVWGIEFALQLQVSSEKEVITDDLGASVHDGDDSDDDEAPIGGHRMDRSDELFSASHSGSGKSRGGAAVTTTSSDDVYDESTTSYDSDKLLSRAVFSEIMNPKAR